MTEQRCPVMYSYQPREGKSLPGPRTISMSLAERAWVVYSQKYGRGQSLQRMIERGGFHANELDVFVPGWRDEEYELTALRAEVARLQEQIDKMRLPVDPMSKSKIVEWECWIDGDEHGHAPRETRRALDTAPQTAAESYALAHGLRRNDEIDRVRVKRVGEVDSTARLIEVRWHLDCFTEDVTDDPSRASEP